MKALLRFDGKFCFQKIPGLSVLLNICDLFSGSLKMSGKRLHKSLPEISDLVLSVPLPATVRAKVLTAFEQCRLTKKDGCSIIHDIACTVDVEKAADKVDSIEEWK